MPHRPPRESFVRLSSSLTPPSTTAKVDSPHGPWGATTTGVRLEEACRQTREWQLAGVADESFYVSVNISARHLHDPAVVDASSTRSTMAAADDFGTGPRTFRTRFAEALVLAAAHHRPDRNLATCALTSEAARADGQGRQVRPPPSSR